MMREWGEQAERRWWRMVRQVVEGQLWRMWRRKYVWAPVGPRGLERMGGWVVGCWGGRGEVWKGEKIWG